MVDSSWNCPHRKLVAHGNLLDRFLLSLSRAHAIELLAEKRALAIPSQSILKIDF